MKLISYNSSESGGMMGGSSSISISYTEDGRCYVVKRNRAYHSQPLVTETYYAEGLLDKLSEICTRYNVISWTDLPDEEIFMLDASTITRYFKFEDGTEVSFGSRKKTPKDAHDLMSAFNELIQESMNYGTDLKVTEETVGLSMGMMGFQQNNTVKVVDPDSIKEDFSDMEEFCSSCNTKFVGSQRFCPECGTPRKKR